MIMINYWDKRNGGHQEHILKNQIIKSMFFIVII